MATEGLNPAHGSAVAAKLARYGPRLPLPTLVYEINRLFHAHEARVYDGLHEVFDEQCPRLWQEMIRVATAAAPRPRWTILDFGCGTGFASLQLIRHLTPAAIGHLTCFDPSPEMLERCREKLAALGDRVTFTANAADLAGMPWRYDLIATNSVLHHLPDPLTTVREWAALMAPRALWLAGHEPSRRFYRQPICRETYAAFVRWRKWHKLWSPLQWLRGIGKFVRGRRSSAHEAAREAYRRGWFRRRPSARTISRLVDLHVPHDGDPASGFDWQWLKDQLAASWQVLWLKTYGFMGRFCERGLPSRWSRAAADLAAQFPLEGGQFCAVWQRL